MAIPLSEIFGGTEVRLTSGYGQRKSPTKGASSYHTGLDLAPPKGTPIQGTPIHSLASGTIEKIGQDAAHGNYIHIRHGNGYVTKYSHLDSLPSFKQGQTVENGQHIANVGKTGITTGPHLHLTLEKDGKKINPNNILGGNKDLQQLIGSTSKVEPKELLATNLTNSTSQKTNKNTETKSIMAGKPNKNADQGTVYGITGNRASEILGKDIKSLTAQDIISMARKQGYSERDARRAAKGLEKFKSSSANLDMVFDPEAARYNLISKADNGEDVVNPRQGRRLGSNAAFGAADLIGLGRDVNYLASVINRERNKPSKDSETITIKGSSEKPKSSEASPAELIDINRVPVGKFNLDYSKIKLPDAGNIPEMDISRIEGEPSEKFSESLLNYVLRRAKEDKSSWDKRSLASKVFAGIPYLTEDQPGATYTDEKMLTSRVLSDIDKTKRGEKQQTQLSNYLFGTESGPKVYDLAPENSKDFEKYYQNLIKRFTPKGDPGSAMGMFSPTTAVPAIGNLLNKIPGVNRLIKAADLGKGAAKNQRYIDYVTNLARPKSVLPPRSPLPPRSALPPRSPYNLDEVIKKARQATKVKANIERAGQINRMAKQMGEGFEKGGKLSASSLMGLPKGRPGIKLGESNAEYEGINLTGETLFDDGNGIYGFVNTNNKSDTNKPNLWEEYGRKKPEDQEPAQDLGTLDEVTVTSKRKRPSLKNIFSKNANIDPNRQTAGKWLGENAGDIARYAAPFIGEKIARKQLNIKPVNYKPVELMTGVVRDLPKNYTPMLNRIENRGSDLLTNIQGNLATSAYNKDKEFAYNMANQQSKLAQQDQILNRINQGKMMNWQGQMRTDMFNKQLQAAMAEKKYESVRSPMLAATQMAVEDANQRATLGAFTRGKELELAAKRGEISPADLMGLKNDNGTITLSDGRVFKDGKLVNAKGGKLKRTK